MAKTSKKKIQNGNPTDAKISDDQNPKPKKQEDGLPEMSTVAFLNLKKTAMKNTDFRRKFDALYLEIQDNLINTNPAQSATSPANSARWTFATTYSNGNMNVFPMLRNDQMDQVTKVPNAREPVAFSKILIAAATLGGKAPDAEFSSDSKVFARAMYELWKRTWEDQFSNGEVTLQTVYQFIFTYGWGAWRTYPRQVVKPKGKTKKIIYDNIYREAMDPFRTWLGTSVNNFDGFARGEGYYEKDIPKFDFMNMYPDCDEETLNYGNSGTQEAKDQKPNQRDYVTLEYYENELTNRYIVASGSYVIYDGELPNDDTFGHIEWANCFVRDINDPYGVGLYELSRGNAAMNDYISQMNAIQVEAEIYPLLFGTNVGNGDMKYRRGPFVINPKLQGTTVDVIRTTGNVAQGIAFADRQKNIISENTGVNDILAGQSGEGTLGGTVILKEAALQRLTLPRNSMVRSLERDAYKTVSWILQTYSVEKIEMFDSEQDMQEFLDANPGLFVNTTKKKKRNGDFKYISSYSPRTQVNFDFQGQKLMNTSNPVTLSRSALIEELKKADNISDVLQIKVDGNSMLVTSHEIMKQQTLELYALTTAKTVEIFQALQTDPNLARALLMQFEQILAVYRQNINKWIPKDLTDQIEAAKAAVGPQPPAQMPPKPPSETINYKDLPPPLQDQLAARAGLQPVPPQGNPGPIRPPTPGEIPAPSNAVRTGMGMSAMSQGARPQNPMRDAIFASVGRAAKGPKPNKTLTTSKK